MVKNLLKVINALEGLRQAELLRNVEHVWVTIHKDQPLIVQELEVDLGIPKTTHVVAKCVPQLLLPEQKEHRAAAVAND